jgi:hypothetical protein
VWNCSTSRAAAIVDVRKYVLWVDHADSAIDEKRLARQADGAK